MNSWSHYLNMCWRRERENARVREAFQERRSEYVAAVNDLTQGYTVSFAQRDGVLCVNVLREGQRVATGSLEGWKLVRCDE